MELNKPVSIIIILVISFLIFILFVLPKYQESSLLQADLFEKQAQYESRVNYYLKISDTFQEISQRQDDLKKVDSALPADFSLAQILYFLEEKAKFAGLDIKSITFLKRETTQNSAEVSNKEIKDVDFNAKIFGSYEGLKYFLMSLERSSRLFEVESISFVASPQSQTNQKNQKQSHDFELDIRTHTY